MIRVKGKVNKGQDYSTTRLSSVLRGSNNFSL